MAFVNDAQRKAVMAKLKGMGYTPKKISAEGQYYRARIKQPSQFQKGSFRTMDIGKKGSTKIIIGRQIGQKTTTTQAILIPKKMIRRVK